MSREFPRLLQKSSAELAELLTDKEAFARFLHSTEGALEARAFTRELRLEIEGMCRANIEKAEEARDLRSQMSVIRSCDAQPVKDAYEAARKKADAVTGKFNLDEALARLKTRARETDQETEKLGEDLVAGKIQPREFIDKYVPMRRLYHMDTVRAEIVEPALASRRPARAPGCPGAAEDASAGHHPSLLAAAAGRILLAQLLCGAAASKPAAEASLAPRWPCTSRCPRQHRRMP